MANDETLAALERVLAQANPCTKSQHGLRQDVCDWCAEYHADAALIRAHIETPRNGGERALTRSHVKAAFYEGWDAARRGDRDMAWNEANSRKLIDHAAIEAGAHVGGE